MKKLTYIISVLGVAFLLTLNSCQEGFLTDYNIDPTSQADVGLSLIMPSMLSQAAYNQSGNPARVAGIIMQQYEGFDAQQVAYTSYVLPDITFNNYWRTGLYAGVLKDCKSIITKAQAEGQPYYEGIAKVIQASELGRAASMFGDIPFSEANQGDAETPIFAPSYDSQQDVYAGVQALLSEAIGLLQQAAVPGGPAGDDLIFGGDAASWIATAHALKARFHMHLTKRNGVGAAESALTELGSAFTSLADQPGFAFENNQISNGPLAKFGIERPNTLIMQGQFVQDLIDNADPRFTAYVDTDSQSFANSGNPALVWAANDAVIPIISYVELKFIEAEALLWTGNGNNDADVVAAMRAGIVASMEQIGIAEADYTAFVDAQATFDGLSTLEEKLEKIMTEAYYSYYGYAFIQTWTNYRRNGYPVLTPDPNGAGGFNPSGIIPRRYIYPSSENQLNEANWQAAIDNQGGGLLDDDTWAFGD